MGYLDNAGLARFWEKARQELAGSGGASEAYLVKAPVGTIVIWSGTADNIPTGWVLCDGKNNTPDLRGKFILGAGGDYDVDTVGGESEVTLTVEQMPEHRHMIHQVSETTGGTRQIGYLAPIRAPASALVSTFIDDAGGNQPHNNMPPYYALCFIQKIAPDETDGVTMEQVNIAINSALNGVEERLSRI